MATGESDMLPPIVARTGASTSHTQIASAFPNESKTTPVVDHRELLSEVHATHTALGQDATVGANGLAGKVSVWCSKETLTRLQDLS